MNFLAIETSSDACSVALQTEAGIDEHHVVAPREHTKRLMPMIESLLRLQDLVLTDLDAVILGNGPGSFIGMRISAAVVQGLAFAAGLKIVPVSSLAAVAAEAMSLSGATRVLVAQDARMKDVYLAGFSADADGLPIEVDAVGLHPLSAALPVDGLESKPVAAGAAWHLHAELAASGSEAGLKLVDCRLPRAKFLLGLGVRDWLAGRAILPDALEPEYVRQQVASVPAS